MAKPVASIITTWLLRILVFIVVLMAVGLVSLSMMGGTSESHRKGLEQAFSDFLKADVTIGGINQFNIIPQLAMKVENVHGVFREVKNEFMIDRVDIAFGFWDLLTGKRDIENFQLENFRFSQDSKNDLRIDHAGIDATEPSALKIKGEYLKRDFDFSVPMKKEISSRASYSFDKTNVLTGHFGALDIKGVVQPAANSGSGMFENLEISSKGQLVAKGHSEHGNGGMLKISIDCPEPKNMPAPAKADLKLLAGSNIVALGQGCE